ncbi:DUF1850 domain-containing protein [Novispirillum itersonii]|uniref:DUF1850 domain-containing protein n=1 Tax=Novispirillum itersonii TaxID=189 RepID=UPI0021AAFC20|nr:DUF1850 domain-containing protein [Novispirillum itersonii]
MTSALAILTLCIGLQGEPPLPLSALPPAGPFAATTGNSGTAPLQTFQLRWLHSVEKTPWEEHWSVTPQGLQLGLVRIGGSGAGMEPPEDARLVNGGFEYSGSTRPPVPQLLLPDSAFTGPLNLCRDDGTGCLPLHTLAARNSGDSRPILLSACFRE